MSLVQLPAGQGSVLVNRERISYIVTDVSDDGVATVTITMIDGYDPVIIRNAGVETVQAVADLGRDPDSPYVR